MSAETDEARKPTARFELDLGGLRELELVPLVNLVIEERTLGAATAAAAGVHYFGLLSVDSFWSGYSLRCCGGSETIADPEDSSSGVVPGRGARLSFEEVSDGLGPLSETEPESDSEEEQRRDDEHADEVATSENGCMGSASRW
jgi:hypothetical protein